MDPNHPNTKHFVKVIGELWADYIRTHSLEECEEINRRVERNRQIRQRMFAPPRSLDD